MEFILFCVTLKVTQDMNNLLLCLFTKEELNVVMEMHPTKAPGPDRLPVFFFFQKVWAVLGDDITKTALNILNEARDVSVWNMTLILKVRSLKSVQEYRPISLCNVLYKIVSGSITNRFRLVLDDIIGDL